MSLFFRNKNPGGRLWRFAFALAEIFDGLVMILSLGEIKTKLPLEVARLQAKSAFTRLVKERQ